MKNFFISLVLVGTFLGGSYFVLNNSEVKVVKESVSTFGASVMRVNQGGTGAVTLTGCLEGNGTSPITGTGSPCGSGGGSGNFASSSPWTSGYLSYIVNNTTFRGVATSSLTINSPLTTSGTAGALVGGTNLTIDIDDIKAADLDLTDITLNDFTNDAGFITSYTSPYEIATTSGISVPQLSYFTRTGGRTTLGGVSTTSVTCSGSTTCDPFVVIGSAPITISSSGGSGGGLGTTTPWTFGNIVTALTNGNVTTISTSTLVNNIFPFNSYGASTSTVFGFTGGLFSTASSTFSSALRLPSLSQGILYTGTGGLVGTVATSSFSLSQFTNDLANLTATNATLTFSGNYNGSVARTVGLNLANPNTWSGLQTFAYSSTTGQSSFIHASTTNFTFGGVTGNDWADFCVSITGSAGLCDGDDATGGGGSSAYEIATTSGIAVPQVAYFTQTGGRTTVGSVATGTIAVPTGLTATANRYVLGGNLTLGLDTGYVIPLQSTLDGKESTLTFNYPLSRSVNTISFNGLGTTSSWTTGQLAYVVNGNTVTSVATTTVTASSPLSLSNPVVKVGGSNSVLSLDTSGTWTGSAGSVANALTAGSGLSSAGTFNGAVARTFSLDLANPNTWTALQTFNYSSSTAYSSFVTASTTNLFAGFITLSTTTAGTLKVASNGVVWSDTSGGGGGGYATIQDEGSGLTVRTILNFTGSGVACADDTTKTTCTINAGAATAGGSDGQVQFNDSTALGGAVGWIWNKTKAIMGIGTTTPFTDHKVSIATSTGQNLVLLTGGNDAGVGMRNIGGTFYISSTSPTTGATSTSASAFIVDYSSGVGKTGIGSTTPWGLLGIQPAVMDYSFPLFSISTSSNNGYAQVMFVGATTSTQISAGLNGGVVRESEMGVRMGVGLWNYEGYGGLLDQLVVKGRINTEDWLDVKCDAPQIVALSADGVLTGCNGFYFAEDGTATTAIGSVTGGGASYTRVAPSTVSNDGGGVFIAGSTSTGWLTLSTSTPVFETNLRIRNSNATTSGYYIGFSNINIAGTAYEAEPTIGCFFVATSTANWRAVCKTANATATYVDTGIASTSSNGANGTAYQFRKFRIEADSTKARFYIKANESSNMVKVAEISGTYPTNTLLNAGMHMGIISQNNTSGFDFFRARFWWRDTLPSL